MVPANVIKLLGESMYINLHDLALGKDFLDVTLKTQETKEKVINWTSPKLKICFKGHYFEAYF